VADHVRTRNSYTTTSPPCGSARWRFAEVTETGAVHGNNIRLDDQIAALTGAKPLPALTGLTPEQQADVR